MAGSGGTPIHVEREDAFPHLKNLVTRWHCSTITFLIPKGGVLGSEMLLIYNSSCKVAVQFYYNAACKNADIFQCWTVAYIML